jgi:uncharacterized membrane protein
VLRFYYLAFTIALTVACASPGSDSADPCADTPVTWEHWGAGFFGGYCRSCHSSTTADRYGAPDGVDFDTLADVRAFAARVRVRVLEQQDMPVGGGVPDDELARLDTFLQCGL